MVTAELAASLPVLVLLLAVALAAVSIGGQRVRAQDAAEEAARAVARGDAVAGQRLFELTAPRGSSLSVVAGADEVSATVRVVITPLGGWLGGYTVVERAVAATEPDPDANAP
jgi:hypothetical protein